MSGYDLGAMEAERAELFTVISSSDSGQYSISNAQLRTLLIGGSLRDLDSAVREFAFAHGYEIRSEESPVGLLFTWRKAAL